MKTVKLITCDDAFQAHIIQGALANEGIDSMLATVPPGGNHWEYICDHCGKAFEKPVTEFNPSALEEKD